VDVTSPENCTCLNLRKAARAVTQMYGEALRPSGLRATQLSVLAVIAHAGPVGMTELAKALVMDRTTLTRNLKPLLDQGLVAVAIGADRRQRPVELTAAGRAALERALPLWRTAQARTADSLGAERWAGLLRDLDAAVALAQAP